MVSLHIEHPTHDFDAWKRAFDTDPIGRERSGVRRYSIHRPVDDPKYVMLDLEFDNSAAAEAALAALRELWQSAAVAALLGASPQARIVEAVEIREY